MELKREIEKKIHYTCLCTDDCLKGHSDEKCPKKQKCMSGKENHTCRKKKKILIIYIKKKRCFTGRIHRFHS